MHTKKPCAPSPKKIGLGAAVPLKSGHGYRGVKWTKGDGEFGGIDMGIRKTTRGGRGSAPPHGQGANTGKLSGGRGRPAVFTRGDILEAAKSVFSKAGYANSTLEDLAAQLNTGKSTLYYHSSSKVDLLVAISSMAVGNSASELRKIAAIAAPPEARFVLAMRTLMHSMLSDQRATKVYLENEADLPPEFRADLRRGNREIQETFVDIIADGVRAGVFKTDSRIAAKHVLAICCWPYRWFSNDGALSLDELITSAVNFALGGLRSDGAALPVRSRSDSRKKQTKRRGIHI